MGLNIIAVDGLDCSGKEHITKLLEQELREKYTTSFNVSRIEFPTYDQTKLIDMLLSKEYADIIEDEFFDSSIYLTKTAAFMEDQFAKILDLYKHDKYSDKTNIYIFDRYYMSNLWYNLAFINRDIMDGYNKLLELLKVYQLPKPSAYFYIDMPFEIIQTFLKEKKNKDYNESNTIYLSQVKNYADSAHYKYNIKFSDNQFMINCMKLESTSIDYMQTTNIWYNKKYRLQSYDEIVDGIMVYLDHIKLF